LCFKRPILLNKQLALFELMRKQWPSAQSDHYTTEAKELFAYPASGKQSGAEVSTSQSGRNVDRPRVRPGVDC
jgi:hypothetical protein